MEALRERATVADERQRSRRNPNAKLTIVADIEDEDTEQLQRLAVARGQRPGEVIFPAAQRLIAPRATPRVRQRRGSGADRAHRRG
jgi:hypothetical protein